MEAYFVSSVVKISVFFSLSKVNITRLDIRKPNITCPKIRHSVLILEGWRTREAQLLVMSYGRSSGERVIFCRVWALHDALHKAKATNPVCIYSLFIM